MSSIPPRQPLSTSRRMLIARIALLFLVPLTLWISLSRQITPADTAVSSLRVARPPGWHYMTATPVSAGDNEIRFDARAIEDALAAGQAAPLFAIVKYPPPHVGVDPMIGVNVARATGTESPVAELERSVNEVQQRSGNALEILQPIAPTTIAGHPAARVVLHAAVAPDSGKAPDRMTVMSVVTPRLSLMIAASGAFEGADTVDATLSDFLASLRIE